MAELSLKINGTRYVLPTCQFPQTVAEACALAGVDAGKILAALNGTLIPANRASETPLHPGDTLLLLDPLYGG
jgi:sulfur carrier protein ThiS